MEKCWIITETGYRCIRTMQLPQVAWIEFYESQKTRIATLRSGALTAEEEALPNEIEQKIQILGKFPDTYESIHYIMQRPI